MNVEYITATTRHLLTAAGGFLIAQGITNSGTVESITGGVVALIGLVWSLTHKQATLQDTPAKKQ